MGDHVLRNANVDGAVVDVVLRDGHIAATAPAGMTSPPAVQAGATETDLDGYVLLPSAVEPHAHLDKAFLADVVHNPSGDLDGAVDAMREAYSRFSVTGTGERAARAIRMFAVNGATTIRTHVDITEFGGLGPLQAVLDAREACRDVAEVEIVALCGFPVLGTAGANQRALLGEAMDMGADIVGGCPHLEPGPPRQVTEYLVGVAASREHGLDLHTDETLDPEMLCLLDLVAAVQDGFAHPMTASHCVSLSVQAPARQVQIAEQLAAAGIGVVALPQTNLYLQGRGSSQGVARGITPVQVLLAAGVAVAAGQDNIQDPFNPLGRGCPLDTAGLMVAAAHLSPGDAYESVSNGARRVLRRQLVTIAAGSPADLLAVRAGSLREAIAMAPPDRLVWRAGQALDRASLRY